jgi:hypothetical protein
MSELSKTDILALDYGGKVSLLERVGQEMLDKQIEFARIAGRYAELKADMEVLKQVKSVLQSSIKAEKAEGGSDHSKKHELTKNPIYNKPKTSRKRN